jgi:zinicin-like metallopeptidase
VWGAACGVAGRELTPHPAPRTPHRGGVVVRLDDFRALVERLQREIPSEFQGGVVAIEVSPKTVPHPIHGDIYTLGECIPLEWSGSGADLQSRVVLYHGSFQALARLGDFDWRAEAWETLTHELRHHLEWRANVAALEAYDWAAEENFKRHEGQAFDPVFYRSGERIAEGVWKVDDDVFVERDAGYGMRDAFQLIWHGSAYRVSVPAGITFPAFLVLEGLEEPPPGDAVLVVPRKATVFNFWRRPVVAQAVVRVDGGFALS